MELYRLCRRPFATALSGKGAALKGARWNSIGTELIYTAANRSLAMAEVAVHFTLATLPPDYVMMTLYAPDDISVEKLDITTLPAGWNAFPHPVVMQAIGDAFVRQHKHCLLQVPSAVTSGDSNFLINPAHPQFSLIRIINVTDFPFDRRIFK